MKTNLCLLVIPQNHNEEHCLDNVFDRITEITKIWEGILQVEQVSYTHSHSVPLTERRASNYVTSQSISVNLLLSPENIGKTTAISIQRLIKSEPWIFHHKFQILDLRDSSVVAKQEFFQLSQAYPLFSVALCDQGPSVLRINIFVREDFIAMRNFYSFLLRSEPVYEKDSFCYFLSKCSGHFQVQLSLKHSKSLHVTPTENGFIAIGLDHVYETIHDIGAKIEQIYCKECGILAIRDPENNRLLVQGRYRQDHNLHRQYESCYDFLQEKDMNCFSKHDGWNGIALQNHEDFLDWKCKSENDDVYINCKAFV